MNMMWRHSLQIFSQANIVFIILLSGRPNMNFRFVNTQKLVMLSGHTHPWFCGRASRILTDLACLNNTLELPFLKQNGNKCCKMPCPLSMERRQLQKTVEMNQLMRGVLPEAGRVGLVF